MFWTSIYRTLCMDGINYSRNHFLVVTCRIDNKKPYHKLNIKMNFVVETLLLLFLLYTLLTSNSRSITFILHLWNSDFNYFSINFLTVHKQLHIVSRSVISIEPLIIITIHWLLIKSNRFVYFRKKLD